MYNIDLLWTVLLAAIKNKNKKIRFQNLKNSNE